MGRFRRKNKYYKKSKSEGSSSKSDSKNDNDGEQKENNGTPFSRTEVNLLKSYLVEYRDGCERICYPKRDVTADDETIVTSPTNTSESTTPPRSNKFGNNTATTATTTKEGGSTVDEKKKAGSDSAKVSEGDDKNSVTSGVVIATHIFPALTDEVLCKPYLALPSTLTPKQRKQVHQFCVELDLFHCGAGPPGDGGLSSRYDQDRHVVISIHPDGFHHVPEMSAPSKSMAHQHLDMLRKCKPWICRDLSSAGTDSATLTQLGRNEILKLVDQPGVCLRDHLDAIDFEEMETEDLSQRDPPSSDAGTAPWMLVDTAAKMQQCVDELIAFQPTEVGFDLEMYNPSKYVQVTCMLQLALPDGTEYVIDTLADGVWDKVGLLGPALFADASVVKVGHAIGGMDVPSLHRDFGIFVLNAFDTHEAAKVLQLKSLGLAGLCKHYGVRDSESYIKLKADYQACDWRTRPLTQDMIRYGRYDVHYLLQLRRLMMRDLTRYELWDKDGVSRAENQMVAKALVATLRNMQSSDDAASNASVGSAANNTSMQQYNDADSFFSEEGKASSRASDDEGFFTPSDNMSIKSAAVKSIASAKELRMQLDLMHVISQSLQRTLDLWTGKNRDESYTKNETYIRIMKLSKTTDSSVWSESHLALLKELIRWRKQVAQTEECLPGMVCSMDLLVCAAWKRPTHESNLRRILWYLPPLLEQSYMQALLYLIQSALNQEEGLVTPSSTSRSGPSASSTRSFDAMQKSRYDVDERSDTKRWKNALRATAIVAVGATAVFVGISIARKAGGKKR